MPFGANVSIVEASSAAGWEYCQSIEPQCSLSEGPLSQLTPLAAAILNISAGVIARFWVSIAITRLLRVSAALAP
jgi:hypothetical protein